MLNTQSEYDYFKLHRNVKDQEKLKTCMHSKQQTHMN